MSFRGTGSGKQVSSRTNRLHSRGRNPQKGLRAASESEAYLTLSHAINNDGHTNSGFKCSTIPHHKWEIFKRFAHTTRPDLGQSANNDIYARQSQEPNIPSQKAKHKKQDPYSTRVIIHSATAHGPDAQLSTGTCLHWQPTSFLLLPSSSLSSLSSPACRRYCSASTNPSFVPQPIAHRNSRSDWLPPRRTPALSPHDDPIYRKLSGKEKGKKIKCQDIEVPGMVTTLRV